MAFAALTLGTETSGSILSPSNANSLVGVKPTMGLLSRAGIIPLAPSFDVPGPMVRNVADAAAMLDALVGPDPRDPATAASAPQLPAPGGYAASLREEALQGVRLGYDPRFDDPLFTQALADLERLGATLVPIDPKDADAISITEIGLIPNEFKASLNQYLAEEAGPGLPVKDLTEVIAFNQQHPDKVKYGQDLLLASDAQPGVMATLGPLALPTLVTSRQVADGLFADNGVDALVGPDAPYTGLGAAAGYPTVVVPSGYDGNEPQGLSFFGPAWSEPALLSYAYAYEQGTRLRLPPHLVEPSLLEGVCGATSAPAPDPASGGLDAGRTR
jgi:amidase